ncbi:serine/threonine-protein phosphatase 6 regulatory subunit 3-like [Dendronephthya gigantea]|uniref:serine/threonine-protein phosphatase 6 regulatory subunit 3-like n=1 Tax=Dendronephthya gigantea TaxID=151771 RepID=UPI00106A1749|nr:serine/threonine-protein phosphatase 6 regulatory subunit 3-like [Dendronephthya gigantea]
MFWKFDLHPSSSLDTILSKDSCTLSEILDEDDVLQECKSQNRKLLDFLTRPDILENLVDMITTEPDSDVEEKLRYKHPNVACELLTSDVQVIVEQMTATDVLLDKLWTFLDTEKTLNPLLASFFSKVFSLLVGRKTTLVLQFLKSKDTPVDRILRHIDTSAIMDLVLKLANNVEIDELRLEVLQWLNDEKLVEKLVDLVDPQYSSDKIYNASQCLCDLIKTSREHMSQLQESAYHDPILSTIENKETLSVLLDHMLHEVHLKSSSDSLVGGISVLLTLLEVNKSNSESPFSNVEIGEPVTALDAERLAHGVTTTLSAIVPKLDGFHRILTDPPPMPAMTTTAGKLEPPFGKTRLQVLKMFSAILQTNSDDVNEEFSKLGTLQAMWELFFQYPWNNFLHAEVEHCINTILINSPMEKDTEHLLLIALMKDLNLVHKITDVFTVQENGSENGCKRHGYMGHLTKIANDLYRNMDKGKNHEKLTNLYNELDQGDKDKWEQFVSGKLAEINKRNNTDLAGRHPLQSSDDDDDEFRPVSFLRNGGSHASYQQAFTHYQLQQMAPEFLENMGFDEDQFPESDEHMNAPFDRIADINFTIDTNEDSGNSAIFEAACNERIHAFDDHDSDEEDIWNTKEITFSSNTELRSSHSDGSESSESEDEEVQGRDEKQDQSTHDDSADDIKDFAAIRTSSPCPEKAKDDNCNMDVDSNEAWSANFESDSVSMDVVQGADSVSVGWASEPNKTGDEEENSGWAKFDDLGSIGETTGQSPSRDQRCSSPVAMDTEASSPPATSVGSAYIVDSEEAEMSDEMTRNETKPQDSEETSESGTDKVDETGVPNDSMLELHEVADSQTSSDTVTDRIVPLAPKEDDVDDDDDEIEADSDSTTSAKNEDTQENDSESKTPESIETTENTEMAKCEETSDSSQQTPVCEGTNKVKDEPTATDVNTGDGDSDTPKQDSPKESLPIASPEKIPVSARNGPTLP